MSAKWTERCLWLSACFFLATVLYNVGRSVDPAADGGNSALQAGYVHDFGTVYLMETREHVFRVQNVWGSPLVIDRVISGCGCTAIGTDLEGRKVEIGETFEVPVRWIAHNASGTFSSNVLVTFQDAARSPLRLKVRVTVVPQIVYSPERFVIEATSANDTRSQSLTVTCVAGTQRFELASVTTNSEILSATFDPARHSESGEVVEWTVTVTTVPPLPEGRRSCNVFLQSADPALAPLGIPAEVTLDPVE